MSGIIDLASGLIGGTACGIIGHPFDTIKVQMQVNSARHNYSMLRCASFCYNAGNMFGSGLYKGFVPAMACNVLENGVLFYFYPKCANVVGQARQKVSDYFNLSSFKKPNESFNKIFGGFFASFFASFVICPTELIKCRMQAYPDHSLLKIVSSVVKHNGVGGFFQGQLATTMREMPGYFLIFFGYEMTNVLLKNVDIHPEVIKTVIAGSVGGSCYWIVLYPLDLIKSRIQVYSTENNNQTATIKQMVKIVMDNSKHKRFRFRALYDGFTPTLIRAVIGNAALFTAYEESKLFMEQSFLHK